AAGMHLAVVARAVREAVFLLDRQRIHVGAQPDRAGRVAEPEAPDDAGASDPAMHLDTEGLQRIRDELGGPPLLEAELRVRVDAVAPGLQLVMELPDRVDRRHSRPLAAPRDA